MNNASSVKPSLKSYQIRAHEGDRHICFDPSSQRLTIQENVIAESVDLGFAPSRILELLISRADTIVSRDEIFEFAWPDRVVGQNSLNQAIATLRELIGDEEKRLIIQTVPRHGYRLSSSFVSQTMESQGSEPVESVVEPSIASNNMAPQGVKGANLARLAWLTNARWQRMGLGGLVLLLTLGLLWRIDWDLLAQPGMVTQSRQVGVQQQLFVAANEQTLSALEDEVSSVSQRLGNLVETPTTVVFTKMHSFYSFVCVDDGGASEFIVVHRSRLRELTDIQLRACLK